MPAFAENHDLFANISQSLQPELVISDFESWSYLFGRNYMLPVISIDNMQIINRCEHPPEVLSGFERDFELTKAIVKTKVAGAFHYLITTFFYPKLPSGLMFSPLDPEERVE